MFIFTQFIYINKNNNKPSLYISINNQLTNIQKLFLKILSPIEPYKTTQQNIMLSQSYIKSAIQHPQIKLYCKDLHCGITCQQKLLSQFLSGCKSLSKMYLIVHLVPFLLFKRKKLKQNPRKQLIKLIIAFFKSMLFAGGYSALVRYGICWWTYFRTYESNCGIPVAILAGISLIFEPRGRQAQIALFCLNKSIQTTYNMGLRRNLLIKIPYGECLLMGLSMGILCYHYFNNKQCIRENYKSAIDKLLKNS